MFSPNLVGYSVLPFKDVSLKIDESTSTLGIKERDMLKSVTRFGLHNDICKCDFM